MWKAHSLNSAASVARSRHDPPSRPTCTARAEIRKSYDLSSLKKCARPDEALPRRHAPAVTQRGHRDHRRSRHGNDPHLQFAPPEHAKRAHRQAIPGYTAACWTKRGAAPGQIVRLAVKGRRLPLPRRLAAEGLRAGRKMLGWNLDRRRYVTPPPEMDGYSSTARTDDRIIRPANIAAPRSKARCSGPAVA